MGLLVFRFELVNKVCGTQMNQALVTFGWKELTACN